MPRDSAYNSARSATPPRYLQNTFRPHHGFPHRHPYHHPCLIHLDNLSILESAYTTTNTCLGTSPTRLQPRKDQIPIYEVLRHFCDKLAMAYVLLPPFAECTPFALNANEAFPHVITNHMPGWVGEEVEVVSLLVCALVSR